MQINHLGSLHPLPPPPAPVLLQISASPRCVSFCYHSFLITLLHTQSFPSATRPQPLPPTLSGVLVDLHILRRRCFVDSPALVVDACALTYTFAPR